jgi:hypothetical protein
LAEQNDEWAVARRYLSPELLAKARMIVVDGGLDDDTSIQHELARCRVGQRLPRWWRNSKPAVEPIPRPFVTRPCRGRDRSARIVERDRAPP